MDLIKISENNFLPQVSLRGELSLPNTGLVLLTGDNGVGKSTLCSYLVSKKLINRDVVWSESNQFRSIYPITVNSIIELFKAEAKNLDQSRFTKLFDAFEIQSWSHRTWEELSSGQGQMLKLLLGLTNKGEVFLLDEPVHFLDKSKLQIVSGIITELKNNHLVIIIDHRIDWFIGSIDQHYHLTRSEQEIEIGRLK